jgi:hypothetical protein
MTTPSTMQTYIKFFSMAAVCCLTFWHAPQGQCQRPTAPQLFPEKTLAYLRIDDTRELKDKMTQTSMGKLSQDPELKPIISTFYSTFNELVQGMQNAIGVTLDELLSIPNGELAVALVPTKESPIFCGLLEAGDELPAVELMLRRLDERLSQQNAEKTNKEIGKVMVTHYRNASRRGRQLGYFTDSGVLVFSNNPDYIDSMAMTWQGSGIDHKPLSDNRDFTTILSKCVGAAGERPQVSFYVDPIGIYREAAKENVSTIAVLATLRLLGIDGIKGLGGSMIVAPNDFDSIAHAHLLLENNRRGVLRAIRPKTGSTEPEAWVNDQVVSYGTMNWDVEKTVKAIAEIVDTFGGENTFENAVVANATSQLGVNFRKDFLELLDNRVSLAQVILPPKRINSQSNVVGIRINDPKRMKDEVLPKFFDRLKSQDARWTSKMSGDINVYWLEFKNENQNIRAPQPAFCMLGDDLLFSDSINSIEHAIQTESNADELLSDALEYKLVRDRIKAQLKDKESSIMFYQRPEESLRLFYDLANDRENIDRLEQASANNPFFQALVAALKSRQLPPFEVISKYTAPSGAFVFEEDDGLHYTAFNMRRE